MIKSNVSIRHGCPHPVAKYKGVQPINSMSFGEIKKTFDLYQITSMLLEFMAHSPAECKSSTETKLILNSSIYKFAHCK